MRSESSSRHKSAIAAAVILLVLPLARTAAAHDPGTIYSAHWSSADAGNVNIHPGTTITGLYKTRTGDGAKRWDLQNQTLDFVMQSTPDPVYPATCDAGHNENMVYRGGLDGAGAPGEFSVWARTVWCYNMSTEVIDNYYMKFDIDETWSLNGEGVAPPAGTLDWFSVAAHEFGHAAGWYVHFTDPSICPEPQVDAINQTMCDRVDYARSWPRTLSTHDIHTFGAQY